MPFVFDHTKVEWPEDDTAPLPPHADLFVYIPPPEFGGAPEPVRFSIATATEAAELHPSDLPQESKRSYREEMQHQERLHEQRRQRIFAIAVPELRKMGVRRVYCRYDGGNDEGFSWLDSVETQDGGRLSGAALTQRLHDVHLLDKLNAVEPMHRPDALSDQQRLDLLIRWWLCVEWATMLLGTGFGTGEYSMYGAFTVDLEAGTITDDRKADPIVENIEIFE